jgi:hypothetical protein
MAFRILVFHTNGSVQVFEQNKEPTVAQLQTIVGGDVETIPDWSEYGGMKGTAYCLESPPEGTPVNKIATAAWLHENEGRTPSYNPTLLGDVVFCGTVGKKSGALSLRHAQILELSKTKSYVEMATELNVPIGTIRSSLSRARTAYSKLHPARENV